MLLFSIFCVVKFLVIIRVFDEYQNVVLHHQGRQLGVHIVHYPADGRLVKHVLNRICQPVVERPATINHDVYVYRFHINYVLVRI